MNFLNRLTIKARLYLLLLIVLVLFTTITSYSVWTVQRIGDIINKVNEHPLIVSNTAADTQHLVLDIDNVYKNAFIENKPESKSKYEAQLDENFKMLHNNMDLIQKLILGEEGQNLAKSTRFMLKEWEQNRYDILNKIMNLNKREEIRSYLEQEENAKIDSLQGKLDEIQMYAKNKAASLAIDTANLELNARKTMTIFSIIMFSLLFIITALIIKSIDSTLKQLNMAMSESMEKNIFVKSDLKGKNEITEMSHFYNRLIEKLEVQFNSREGINRLSEAISGDMEIKAFSNKAISFLAEYTKSGNGALYLYSPETGFLDLVAAYAKTERQDFLNHLSLGESVVGQVAADRKPIILKNIKSSEGVINSGTLSKAPLNIYGVPLIYEDTLCGVIELSSFELFDQKKQEFLEEATHVISVNLLSVIQNARIQNLLEQTQNTNKIMEQQQEELLLSSAELISNNTQLGELLEKSRQQSEELQTQQEELRVTNEELAERSKLLETQRENIEKKNEILSKSKLEIEEKSRALEVASKYKSEFLANMSHELRTPLNSILVLSQTLADKKDNDPLTKKQLEYAKTIYSAGNDLLYLINDVLDIAKVEAGKIELVNERIDLMEFSEMMYNQFEHVAEKRSLTFETNIDGNLPPFVIEDRTRLEQVLKNLISNAMKFTVNGGVKLNIYAQKVQDDNQDALEQEERKLIFSVEDTGIGIPEDKRDIIFEAFKQVDGTISRKFGGTGLGLSISMGYAQLMGGTITVESNIGVGSKFQLVLPEKKAENIEHVGLNNFVGETDHRKGTENKTQNGQNGIVGKEKYIESNGIVNVLRGKRILLADDDMRNVFALSGLLEDNGMEVVSAKNGREAIEKLKGPEKIDLVIMDIMMPEMDGLQAMSEIRKTQGVGDIPIIALTAKAMKEDRVKSMEAGANEYITKPIDNHKMINILKVWLHN